jgi:hypothetical protein
VCNMLASGQLIQLKPGEQYVHQRTAMLLQGSLLPESSMPSSSNSISQVCKVTAWHPSHIGHLNGYSIEINEFHCMMSKCTVSSL